MAKPKQIPIPKTDYFAWEYEEQTQVKHRVLDAYFKIWVSKLGAYYDTLFVDCHGGCGAYIQSGQLHYGSTILTHNTAIAVNESPKRTKKHGSIVCEIDKENYDNLAKVLDCLKLKKVLKYNDDFNNVIQQNPVADWVKKFPTLFFVDPFGYYNTPMINMATMLNTRGSEVLINFMHDFISRGISVKGIDETELTAFFGSDEWKQAKSLTGIERESFLINLYKQNLKKITNARFVFAYKLRYPQKDQTYYYLVHATNNIQGITLMKDSFAAVNFGRVEYLGKRNNQSSFFDMDTFKQSEIAALLQKTFAGKNLSFLSVWEAIAEDTAFLESDLRKTIQEMEQKNDISVTRVESKKTGIRGKDIIHFGKGETR